MFNVLRILKGTAPAIVSDDDPVPVKLVSQVSDVDVALDPPGLLAGPAKLTADNTVGGKTLTVLLGAELNANLKALHLCAVDAGITWDATVASATTAPLPQTWVRIPCTKLQAEGLKFFINAASGVFVMFQEG